MSGETLPTVHTVGFFAEEQRSGPGERFLRQLSALTGGSFQVGPTRCLFVLDAALPEVCGLLVLLAVVFKFCCSDIL